MKSRPYLAGSTVLLGVFLLQLSPSFAQNAPLTVEYIMRDQKWLGSQPGGIHWSDDSRYIYFNWNPDGLDGDSLYIVDRKDGEPRQVTLEERRRKPSQGGDYTRDWKRRVYAKDGDLFLLDIVRDKTAQITSTVDWESQPTFLADEAQIAFHRDGNIYIWDQTDGSITQVTHFRQGKEKKDQEEPGTDRERWLRDEALGLSELLQKQKAQDKRSKAARDSLKPDRPLEIYGGKRKLDHVALSPDGRFVVFELETPPESVKQTEVPKYVTESGYLEEWTGRPKVGSPESRYEVGIYDREGDSIYYVATDSIPGIYDPPTYLSEYESPDTSSESEDEENEPKARPVRYTGPYWPDKGPSVLYDIRSQDYKDRWLMLLDLETGTPSLVDHQHDEAWIGGPGAGWRSSGCGWLKDNQTIWYQSEASGYTHIYTFDTESGTQRQHTAGDWEVSRVSLSRDGKYWYFNAGIAHPGERQFYRLPTKGGEPEKLIGTSGYSRVVMSPDEKSLAIRYSYSNRPWQLYVQDNKPGAKARRITHSISEEFLSYPWRDPEIVTFTAADSAIVYARLYRPDEPKAGGPGVIFVHGAGYLQNAHRWWSYYSHEFMFHNLLADQGYTVLDIDYRGSSGYGRDWRTGIYRYMGDKDLSDQVDGARFLVEQYDVDSARIGIYGGSYGGFITLMAMFTEPGIFACGAALRSVTDWAHYNHPYTARILNTPVLDSLAYVRSSPIYFAEGLEGALLMCHGMLDVNVQYQDILRLTQRLIELGKENWELATYPLERHSFREPESWTDEYRRIFKLFEEHLK